MNHTGPRPAPAPRGSTHETFAAAGVVRPVDAGCEHAIEIAPERDVDIPMLDA